MLPSLYEFREDQRRKVLLILRAWQQLYLHVYRKYVWHLERKERLVKACSLLHGLQHLLAWSVSRCMCLPTNQNIAAQCTTNITWRHSQTTCIPFKTCSPPVSAVRLFHVRAVAFDFLQLIAIDWLGLHQLTTCKSSEKLSINTDLTEHLYMFRHSKFMIRRMLNFFVFWVITLHEKVWNRRFRTTCWPLFKGIFGYLDPCIWDR
jgi:hypothetical protein